MAAATFVQIVSHFLLGFLALMERVNGHGIMSVPPMRSSMWRYGFLTPINYDDGQLWCGGYGVSQNAFKLIKTLFLSLN